MNTGLGSATSSLQRARISAVIASGVGYVNFLQFHIGFFSSFQSVAPKASHAPVGEESEEEEVIFCH